VSVLDGVWVGGVVVSVLDGVCVVGVELGLVGVCVASGVLVLGDVVEGVVVWSGVVVLGLEVVLPEVCASITRLNVNTSAMINKTFFMLFSNSSSRWGLRRSYSEKLCSEHLRPHLHQQIVTMPARCHRWPLFNTFGELRLRPNTAILCCHVNV
jgi:hypothetical protein